MNSFKAVKEALAFEIERQSELLDAGEDVVQETRLWDAKELKTLPMRTKEEAKDYRYFPEPDLAPFIIKPEKIEEIRKVIPELPRQKMQRFIKDYGLSEYDARILVSSRKDADWAEDVIRTYPDKNKKPIVNWIIGPLASLTGPNTTFSELKLPGGKEEFIKLVGATEEGKISHLMAKNVLSESINSGIPSLEIIQNRNLFQVSDLESLKGVVENVLKENPESVNDYKSGKANALMFLVGQAMKKSKGRANPKTLQEILKRRLTDA
jgi:aspartyl-tRNA(Asn)/glutamyl-tRNA(Gln) amidotransferase subunit B